MMSNTSYTFVIPLETIRWDVVRTIKTTLAKKESNVYAAAISLFENSEELQTFIKDLVIGIVLGLGRFDKYGHHVTPAHAQPFIHSEHKATVLFLLERLITKIFDICFSSFKEDEITELTNDIFHRCENIVIETLNQYMNGLFPHAGNLVSVKAISSQPRSDICITIMVEIIDLPVQHNQSKIPSSASNLISRT